MVFLMSGKFNVFLDKTVGNIINKEAKKEIIKIM